MVLSLPFLFGLKSGMRLPSVKLSAWRTPGAPGLLFVTAVYAVGAGATYAFCERLGHSIAVQPFRVAQVLAIGPALGLLGSFAAVFLSGRVPRSYAFAGSLAGCAFACLLLSFSTSLAAYTTGIWLFWFMNIFFYCYMLGTAAVLDPSGRLATLTGGIERLSYGAGAWFGGAIVEHAGYSASGLIGFVGCSLGVAFGCPFVFRAVRLRSKETGQRRIG
jgi:predicted MFS family arabinose efflux permease